MDRAFLLVIALSLITLVTAISVARSPEPRTKDEDELAAAIGAYTLDRKSPG
jgi:hypothetical protein